MKLRQVQLPHAGAAACKETQKETQRPGGAIAGGAYATTCLLHRCQELNALSTAAAAAAVAAAQKKKVEAEACASDCTSCHTMRQVHARKHGEKHSGMCAAACKLQHCQQHNYESRPKCWVGMMPSLSVCTQFNRCGHGRPCRHGRRCLWPCCPRLRCPACYLHQYSLQPFLPHSPTLLPPPRQCQPAERPLQSCGESTRSCHKQA